MAIYPKFKNSKCSNGMGRGVGGGMGLYYESYLVLYLLSTDHQ